MEKDFDQWNYVKQELDERCQLPSFQEREVWWCSVGINIGYEVYGKSRIFTRPVLIVRKFSRFTFLGVPLTTSTQSKPYHYPIHFLERDGHALLGQVRTFDGKRLRSKMGYITDPHFDGIREALKAML